MFVCRESSADSMKKFQIINLNLPFSNKFTGFTLIELLVVIGIVIGFSFIVFSVILTVLRGANKSDSIIIVKQNGDYAIDQIVKTLRFARSLDDPTVLGGASPSCSSSGTTVQTVRITKIDLTTATVSCPVSLNSPNFISLNGRMLTNSSAVVVTSCSLVCKQELGRQPNIGVFFTLSKVNSSGLPDDEVSIPFQTSVVLRNPTN
jgi:type II secretory pathway pseudopilin PulG